MAKKEPKSWITIKGRHIPLFEGETKADAVKRLKEGVKKGPQLKKKPESKKPKVPDGDDKPVDKKDPEYRRSQLTKALKYAKEKIDKESYSWKETILDAQYEFDIPDIDMKYLKNGMKIHAIKAGKFKEDHKAWKKQWEAEGFDYKQYTNKAPKELKEVHKPEDLIPKDSYTNKEEYKIKSDWLKDNSKKQRDREKQINDLQHSISEARRKYIDPNTAKTLGKDLAETLVKDEDHPDIMELNERLSRLKQDSKEYIHKMVEYNKYFKTQDKANSLKQRNLYGRPEFEKAGGEYAGFETARAHVSDYDDLLAAGKAQVLEMTPEEYIHECAHYIFPNSTFESVLRGRIEDEDTKRYAKMMRDGVKFHTPYLQYSDDPTIQGAQEGLHRAIAAYINGIEKIPVIVAGHRW